MIGYHILHGITSTEEKKKLSCVIVRNLRRRSAPKNVIMHHKKSKNNMYHIFYIHRVQVKQKIAINSCQTNLYTLKNKKERS